MDRYTISIGENVSSHKKKFKHLRANEWVEVLHCYVAHQFKKRRVRKSLTVAISINNYRVGYGADYMDLNVIVTEHDKQLKTFTVFESTRRSSIIKRLSKSLAKKIYLDIKSL